MNRKHTKVFWKDFFTVDVVLKTLILTNLIFFIKYPLFNLLKLHALCMASYNNDIFTLFLKALDIVSSNTGHLLNVPDQPVSILCLKL